NQGAGIRLCSNATANTIGDRDPSARNVIEQGVFLEEAPTSNNLIGENFIGSDITGKIVLDATQGVVAVDAAGDTNNGIFGNLIVGAGPNTNAINMAGTGNQIQGNLIGTDITGAVRLGNAGSGTNGIHVSGNSTIIGGQTDSLRNVIANSGNVGILIDGSD